jgi:hypothetical protein
MGAEHSRRSHSRRNRQPTTVPPLPIITGKNSTNQFIQRFLLTYNGGFWLDACYFIIFLLSKLWIVIFFFICMLFMLA